MLKSKRRMRRRRPLRSQSLSLVWILFLYWLNCITWAPREGSTGIDSSSVLFPRMFVFAIPVEETDQDNGSSQVPGRSRSRKIQSSLSNAEKPSVEKPSFNQILIRAGGGGIAGALAGIVQVLTLMWLRTIMSYQCRYGTTFSQALVTLLREGGIARLYRGLSFALVQAPLARFVSIAANDGVESLLPSLAWTKLWGPGRTTVVASIVVGLFRIFLMRKSSSMGEETHGTASEYIQRHMLRTGNNLISHSFFFLLNLQRLTQ
jgi:hypothetical protein